MKAYLLRHAEPVDPHTDPSRPLSEHGRRQAEKMAHELEREKSERPARIFHSGKLRARQTAEIISSILDGGSTVEEAEGLMPGDDPAAWRVRLDNLREDALIVAHMPFIARLASQLSSGGPSFFATAQAACYQRGKAGDWRFIWTIDPDEI